MNSIESSTARTSPDRQVRELRWSGAINSGVANSSDAPTAKKSADHLKRELRWFGLLMAAAFATLGTVSLWRGKFFGPYSLGLAAAFLLAGLVLPRLLAPIEKAWKGLATLISVVMTYLVLTVLFFVVITPMGVVMRLCGRDALQLRKAPAQRSFWEPVDRDAPLGRPTKPF